MPIENITRENIYKDFLPKNQKNLTDLKLQAVKNKKIIIENNGIKLKDYLDDENKKFTRTVGFSTVIATIVGLGVIKGFSLKWAHYLLNTHLPYVVKLIKNPKETSKMKNFMFKSIGVITRLVPKLASINNIVAIKDSALLLLGESSFGQKIKLDKLLNWITKKCQAISIKAFHKSYEKARKNVDKDTNELQKLIKQLQQEKKLNELQVKILEDKVKNINFDISEKKERDSRLESIKKYTNNTGKEVRNKIKEIYRNKEFFNKNANSSWINGYITYTRRKEEFFLDNTEWVLRSYIQSLTYNTDDKTHEILKNFFKLLKYIPRGDKIGLQKAKELIINLLEQKKFKDLGDIRKVIETQLKNLELHMKNNDIIKIGNSYNTKSQFIDNKIAAIKEIVLQNRDRMGILEKLVVLARFFELKENDIQKIKKITHRMRKTIKKTTNMEIEMYDKFAEYSVGSAPTDVIGVILPILCGGYIVFQSKNNNERVSATLKAGIPIIGGVGTALYTTTRMVSNFKGIVYGTIVGFMLNFLGKEVDIAYKNHQKHKIFYAGH